MNHTIARQSIQFNKPDVVANMNFDTYGAIPDYASMWCFDFNASPLISRFYGIRLLGAAFIKYF